MKDLLAQYDENNFFGNWLGMSYRVLEPGVIEYTLPIHENYQALPGMAHGGCIAAFMDGILGVAALSSVCNEGKYVATVEFKINYLKPTRTKDTLLGIGKVLKKGKRLIVVEGKIFNSSKEIVALSTGTFTTYPAELT